MLCVSRLQCPGCKRWIYSAARALGWIRCRVVFAELQNKVLRPTTRLEGSCRPCCATIELAQLAVVRH